MGDLHAFPEGLTIEAVDWLPSGGRSGLVRVRGRWNGTDEIPLPELVVERGGEVLRYTSLPDPRTERQPGAWRGAYVVHADVAQAADARLFLEFAGRARVTLPRPADSAQARAADPGGEVVDRAVLADRRARRAEAAEHAQARIAREALKAVEVLELRAAELEERLDAATAERDTLASRAGGADEASRLVASLRERLADAEASAQELRSRPAPAPQAGSIEEAERRAARLRDALTTAITTVGELRLQLHEARLRSRTAEIAQAADSVRLAVLATERSAIKADLAEMRRSMQDAQAVTAVQAEELERANARIAGAEAAHAETRRRFTERVEELGRARERIAALETELAATRAEAQQTVQETIRSKDEELAGRLAEAERAMAEREAEAEAALGAARADVQRVETALVRAETAREMAEAAAAAAQMHAAATDVARASGVAPDPKLRQQLEAQALELATLDAELHTLRAEREAQSMEVERVREERDAARLEIIRTAEVQEARMAELREELAAALHGAAALEHELDAQRAQADPAPRPPSLRVAQPSPVTAVPDPSPGSERVVADLEAAAAALRARTPAPEAPEPAAGVQITSPAEPPRFEVATGRSLREYTPLRGALVKLAHDDAEAAGRLIAGLLPAQWRIIGEPVDYDLTLAEVGRYAVTVTAGTAHVRPITAGRREAEFHLRADAVALAEMLTGHGPKPRRFGRVKLSGRGRRFHVLEPVRTSSLSLGDCIRAGARLDPELVLRALTYAVHPSWTAGHDFTIAFAVSDGPGEDTLFLTSHDGKGLTTSREAPAEPPQATVVLSRVAFDALVAGDPASGRPPVRGDERVARTVLAWADRARGLPG